jgi:hypothetical protein
VSNYCVCCCDGPWPGSCISLCEIYTTAHLVFGLGFPTCYLASNFSSLSNRRPLSDHGWCSPHLFRCWEVIVASPVTSHVGAAPTVGADSHTRLATFVGAVVRHPRPIGMPPPPPAAKSECTLSLHRHGCRCAPPARGHGTLCHCASRCERASSCHSHGPDSHGLGCQHIPLHEHHPVDLPPWTQSLAPFPKKEIETNINLQLTCRKGIGFHSPTCTYMDRYFLLMESCPAFFVGERGHSRSKLQLVKLDIHKVKRNNNLITGATIKQHIGNLIGRILTITVIYFATEYGIKLVITSSSCNLFSMSSFHFFVFELLNRWLSPSMHFTIHSKLTYGKLQLAV